MPKKRGGNKMKRISGYHVVNMNLAVYWLLFSMVVSQLLINIGEAFAIEFVIGWSTCALAFGLKFSTRYLHKKVLEECSIQNMC